MKYALFSAVILGGISITTPAAAQFSSSSDGCSSFCVKLDLGSSNNDNSFNSFSSGFGNSSSTSPSNLRWQVGVTWRPNPPEVAQAEGERTKQRLEDNRSLITTLAEAIAQNKTELARGLAILLAPRLNYSNPLILLAEMKQGSMNIGSVPTGMKPVIPAAVPVPTEVKPEANNSIPAFTDKKESNSNSNSGSPIELK